MLKNVDNTKDIVTSRMSWAYIQTIINDNKICINCKNSLFLARLTIFYRLPCTSTVY